MRAYIIDEISARDLPLIVDHLKKNEAESNIKDLFWVNIPEEYLDQTQALHKKCGPFRFAVELGPSWVRAEFFVRSCRSLSCTCNRYCTAKQRDYILEFMDRLLIETNIQT